MYSKAFENKVDKTGIESGRTLELQKPSDLCLVQAGKRRETPGLFRVVLIDLR